MLRFVKGTLRRLIQYVFVSSGSRESLRNVLLARSFKMVEQANELLCGVRHSNIVMLAFCSFLCKVFSKRWIPMADIFGRIVKGISKIARTTFFHM